ncbi:DUF6355 family natural product biosynthesis protein [Saccharothrix variisporea]|uniref:Secreted protein n=1 Tax=Saccharothrix variisporea TaxID=543527 RepID=A0A495X6E2_9PSEU|nr:DUF6355 family natural product biosynthesis protein [Saccharothrix variisporea]RKT69467.1 hypothetical protein DFJ66_2697 [Saccharothrix variisporea]
MSSATFRRAATLASALAALALAPTDDATAQASCGFHHVNPDHHEGAVALYTHCADSFILIRVDHSNGYSYHRCVVPWGSVPFFRNEGVTNAYYVPITPDTMVVNGQRLCRSQQPPV